jgi:RNA polymerase sigma-70 factor, ECF subfamily
VADDREDIERNIRELVVGDVERATTLAIKTYGPELLGFLTAMTRDRGQADEAFSDLCERIWRSLPTFRWEASLRTWAYQLARHALHRLRRDPRARADRNLPLSIVTSIAAVPRTETAPFQRSEVKTEIRAMIEALDPEDREIMILRLDRGMAWKDIADALADEDTPSSTLDQRAAACRKRYERIKAQLKISAADRGLLGD